MSEVVAQLQLHHINTHGGEGETENEIDDADEHVPAVSGNEIAETCCVERENLKTKIEN